MAIGFRGWGVSTVFWRAQNKALRQEEEKGNDGVDREGQRQEWRYCAATATRQPTLLVEKNYVGFDQKCCCCRCLELSAVLPDPKEMAELASEYDLLSTRVDDHNKWTFVTQTMLLVSCFGDSFRTVTCRSVLCLVYCKRKKWALFHWSNWLRRNDRKSKNKHFVICRCLV